MNQGKRLCQILIIAILCILIFYAGLKIELNISEEMQMRVNQLLFQESEKMYLSGFTYLSGNEGRNFGEWLADCVMNMMPLGSYVQGKEVAEVEIEDQEIYEMILEKQANDENVVNENGELVQGETAHPVPETTQKVQKISREKMKDYEYLMENFYTVDGSTSVNKKWFKVEKMLKKDMTISSDDGPKVLIYHTHSQEAFKDSKKGDEKTSIVGMGAQLAKHLNDEYGIETLHHKESYDLVDGKLDRSKAYQLAEKDIAKILKKYPSIEVVIDLHRDGVGENTHLVTEIDGKKTGQIMFFNGLSRTKSNGDIAYLENPYIEDNLAFSLQMQVAAMEKYPGFTRRIYLKSYRYNMHLKPKTLLIEAGAQTNTVKEMENSMRVLADVLASVLKE